MSEKFTDETDVILWLAEKLGEERAMAERREDDAKAEILALRQQINGDPDGWRAALADHRATIAKLQAENEQLRHRSPEIHVGELDGTHGGIVTNWQERVGYLEHRLEDTKGDLAIATGWNGRLKATVEQLVRTLDLGPAFNVLSTAHSHCSGSGDLIVVCDQPVRLCPICAARTTIEGGDGRNNPETEGTETR